MYIILIVTSGTVNIVSLILEKYCLRPKAEGSIPLAKEKQFPILTSDASHYLFYLFWGGEGDSK